MAGSPAQLFSVAGIEAIVIGALAVLYAAIWRRTREPGMPWLAAGFALAAAWYGYSDRIPYTGLYLDTDVQRIGALVIGSAVVLITVGVSRHLGMPRGRLRLLVVACWAVAVATIAVAVLTPWMTHRVFHVGVLMAYVGVAAVAFRRATQRPGDGHLLLGLALLSLPITPFVMVAAGLPPSQLKYFAGISVALFGMLLLTVSLLRRQRWLAVEIERRSQAETELREVNVRLEARVQERTAHLHELIHGLEAFNRSVSHDLRGPLGGMSSLARLAADALGRGDDALARRALPLIASQCETSVDMVNTMLELARLGDTPVQREVVSLPDVVRSAFDEVMLSHPGRTPPTLGFGEMPLVMADPRLMRAVFVNLLGNAVKFTRDAAQPRIELRAEAAGRDVTVCVEDNGVGFDAGVAERLFEPFYRAHAASFEGHGLGLSIVRRAVEAMGGTVRARASAQGGASIQIVLRDALAGPARDADERGAREGDTHYDSTIALA
jgi:signal transduction histidine kinase